MSKNPKAWWCLGRLHKYNDSAYFLAPSEKNWVSNARLKKHPPLYSDMDPKIALLGGGERERECVGGGGGNEGVHEKERKNSSWDKQCSNFAKNVKLH